MNRFRLHRHGYLPLWMLYQSGYLLIAWALAMLTVTAFTLIAACGILSVVWPLLLDALHVH